MQKRHSREERFGVTFHVRGQLNRPRSFVWCANRNTTYSCVKGERGEFPCNMETKLGGNAGWRSLWRECWAVFFVYGECPRPNCSVAEVRFALQTEIVPGKMEHVISGTIVSWFYGILALFGADCTWEALQCFQRYKFQEILYLKFKRHASQVQ